MKNLMLALVLLVFAQISFAQYPVEWKKYKIKYETTEKLDRYQTESSTVYGMDNMNLAVDIAVMSLDQETREFVNSPKAGAFEMAETMGMQNIQDGGEIPKIKSAYYVVAKDQDVDGSLYPNIALVIIRKEMGIAYEITIDCYNKKLEDGLKIAKSFELTQ
ncbi:MAG: hypothetical protein MRY83_01240 [Flavobacteriales bacterium]|nr:hypothetical protein [Flavobacteriales bacterium]